MGDKKHLQNNGDRNKLSSIMNRPRIGRNERCWCGSGRKFKNCHMERAAAEPIKISEMLGKLKKAFGKELCLFPRDSISECSGDIAKAHTVQRAALAKIAERGHVYAFEFDDNAFSTRCEKEKAFALRRKGIGRASIFTGFCAKHDNEIFRDVEDKGFICCAKHAFLLGYRALCREVFLKRALVETSDLHRKVDSGRSLLTQIAIQQFLSPFLAGAQAGYNDLSRIKTEYDRILREDDFRRIKYYAIIFDRCPDVLCSGAFFPVYDFSGVQLQKLDVPGAESVQFSMVAIKNHGVACFTWLEESGVSEKFVNSLHRIKDSELPSAIVRFAFEYFENTYFRISWWDNLLEGEQKRLHQRMAMVNSITVEAQPNGLIDDGVRPVNWTVVERKTNSKKL